MTTNYPAQDSTPAPMTRRQKRRTIAGIIAISATVAGLSAACGPDDNSTEGAAAVGYSAPVSSSSAAAPANADYPDATRDDLEAAYSAYLTSEMIILPAHTAEEIAYKACQVLKRNVKDPADTEQAGRTLAALAADISDEYPVTELEAATMVGAGTVVYCDEYSDSFGN